MRRWLPILLALTWTLPVFAQDANTGTGADTLAAVDPAKPSPKIGTVVAGDPDETLRQTAAFVESEVVVAGLRTPTDPVLRAAMRGDPITSDDGLDGLRSIRRGLGFDPRKDLDAYKRIGIIAGADALVVVHREGDILIEVFDVSAAQFYEGTLKFDDSSTVDRVKFIKSRAEQAQLRWAEPPPPPPAAAAPAVNETEKPADESRAKRRIKKAWPYLLAGALLAGAVTYLIIDRRSTDEVRPPLLRFTPGEE